MIPSQDFLSVASQNQSLWDRAITSQSRGHVTCTKVSQSILEDQLSYHLGKFESAVEEGNSESVSNCLKHIRSSLTPEDENRRLGPFVFKDLEAYKTHEILLELLDSPMEDNDIKNIMDILCRRYLSDERGRKLLRDSSLSRTLLDMTRTGCNADYTGDLFVGLLSMMIDVPGFKQHFIEEGFVDDLKQAYAQLEGDTPVLEFSMLIMELMSDAEEDWVDTLIQLVPILGEIIDCDLKGQKHVIYAYRALFLLVRKYMDTRSVMVDERILEIAFGQALSSETDLEQFQVIIQFLAALSRDGSYADDIMSTELIAAVCNKIREVIEYRDKEPMYQIFVDTMTIATTMPELLSMVFQSELFDFMKEVVDNRSPHRILVEISRVVVHIIMITRDLDLINVIWTAEFVIPAFETLIQMDDANLVADGLFAIKSLMILAQDATLDEITTTMMEQEEILENVNMIILDNEFNDSVIALAKDVEEILQGKHDD